MINALFDAMPPGVVFVFWLLVLLGGGHVLFWLSCRLKARRCPNCGSKWRTELWGEWDSVEDWKCHGCGLTWGYNTDTKTDDGWRLNP